MIVNQRGWKKFLGLTVLMICGSVCTSHAKISRAFAKRAAIKALQSEAVVGEFVVQMNSSKALTMSLLTKELASLGMEVKSIINPKIELYLVKQKSNSKLNHVSALAALNAISGVEFAEPNFIYRIQGSPSSEVIPPGTLFSKLWGMKNTGQPDPAGRVGRAGADIGATRAWSISQGSKDIVVAIIDTGIDYTHPALKDNLWVKPKANPGDADVYGYNAITGVEDPMDDNAHGTHCAGTIGASGLNPLGVVGVNWNVRMMGVKFLSGSGSGTLADAIKSIDWAADNGAQIMSNSWGGGGFSQSMLDAINRAKDKGILFIAAAGNATTNIDQTAFYPAGYEAENVLAVGATNNSDEMAYFSNFGTTKVKVAAPGLNIYSTVPGADGYASFSGTSMACPHVSGAAALLLAKEPSLNFDEVKNRIISTSDKVLALKRKFYQGNRLNLFNMLSNIIPPPLPVPPEESFSPVVPGIIESAHPYADNATTSWKVSHPGASYMKIKFGKFDTESGYDIVNVKNAITGEVIESYSGSLGEAGFTTSEIQADSVIIEFKSDSSINRWGFLLEGYSWSSWVP